MAGLDSSLSPIARRLAEPARRLAPRDLAGAWFVQAIEARVPLMGVLARRTDVLPKVRGAWGRCLMKGASREAIAQRPCPFEPPCALDIFFREQLPSRRHGAPKPYVFEADKDGADLIVRLKIFGMACDWTLVAAERLTEALTSQVDWRGLSGVGNAVVGVTALEVRTMQGIETPAAPGAVSIRLVTPFEDEQQRMADDPASFVARLARRVSGLALWHEAEIDVMWSELAADWAACDYRILSPGHIGVGRASRGRVFAQAALGGEVEITGPLERFWPLLVIGQTTGAGRGAGHGLGRYELAGV